MSAEYLKSLLPRWWESGDTVISVARILNDEGMLTDVDDAITFFEKPWSYGKEIKEIIKNYESTDEEEE